MADPEPNSPRNKRQRLNTVDVWDEDEDDGAFTAEHLAQIDAMISQVVSSQSTSVPPTALKAVSQLQGSKSGVSGVEGTSTGGRMSTWTASGVVPETGHEPVETSTSITIRTPQVETTAGAKSWNSPLVGSSMQELERQKQELQRRRQETIDAQEQVKSLRDTIASKDVEAERTKRELELSRQEIGSLRDQRKQADKRSEKLQLELDFLKQESNASKWSSSQQPTRAEVSKPPLNKPSHSKPPSPPPPSLTMTKAAGQPPQSLALAKPKSNQHGFPTSSSFVKRLEVVNNARSAMSGRSITSESTTTKKDTVTARHKVNTLRHLETGPGLMALLLSKQNDDLRADSILSELLKKHWFMSENGDMPDAASSSSLSSKSVGVRLNPLVDYKFGLLKLLKDDDRSDTTDAMETEQQQQQATNSIDCLPADLMSSRLGLRNDCATLLLVPIEDTLSLLECSKPIASAKAQQNLALVGHGVGGGSTAVSVRSWISTTLASSSSGHSSSAEAMYVESMSVRLKASLKLLEVIVNYSPKVRHCLMAESDVNHRPTLSSNAPCQSSLDSATIPSQCFILAKLFKFCEQSIEMENKRIQELLLIVLNTFTSVASFCSIEQLARFQPILSSIPVQNCATLALNGSVFLQFLKFITALFASPAIVNASSCYQDEFCLWKTLACTWKRAANELPLEITNEIDMQMVIILTMCCTDEETIPSFLISEDCLCPFELSVVTMLVLFLDRQRRIKYEKSENLIAKSDVELLRKGVSQLLRLVELDKHFSDHRRPVDVEFFAFIYWLPRVHRHLKLGKAAEVLMEMWNAPSLEEELS